MLSSNFFFSSQVLCSASCSSSQHTWWWRNRTQQRPWGREALIFTNLFSSAGGAESSFSISLKASRHQVINSSTLGVLTIVFHKTNYLCTGQAIHLPQLNKSFLLYSTLDCWSCAAHIFQLGSWSSSILGMVDYWIKFSWCSAGLFWTYTPCIYFPDPATCPIVYSFNSVQIVNKMLYTMKNNE